MKLTVIGGGSTYTPELADGLGRLAPAVTELVLVDPDEDRLAATGPVSARIMAAHGHQAKVRWTTSLDDGAESADAVLIQLRVGGQAARDRDETWPLDFGCVGQETTGAGGLAKALRTVPIVLEIAERARARASANAWLIDFTNPVGIVTRALLDAGHRAIGLCNVAIGFQRFFASLLGVDPGEITLDHAGLNHLTWERAVYVNGIDRLPELLAGHADEIAERCGMESAVLDDYGFVPSYYLRYFWFHGQVVGEERAAPSRAARVAEIERDLLRMYRDPALDTKPDLLFQRGGAFYSEAAVALLAALTAPSPTGSMAHERQSQSPQSQSPQSQSRQWHMSANRGRQGDIGASPSGANGTSAPYEGADRNGGLFESAPPQVVNIRNNGILPFLPDEAVVEVPALIGRSGPEPVPVTPMEPLIQGLVAHVSAYEELALDAALRGGRKRVEAALLTHPLIGQYDLARSMADRLLAENAAYLPWINR